MVRFSQLKEKWAFCYTEEQLRALLDEMYELLKYFGHNPTKYGIMCLLDKFIDNKKSHIELLMKHPEYNGNLQVVFPMSFDRDNSAKEIRTFIEGYLTNVQADKYILSKTDSNGKTMQDFIVENLVTDKTIIKISELSEIKRTNPINVSDIFDNNGYTNESINKKAQFKNVLSGLFRYKTSSSLDKSDVEYLKELLPELKFAEGMKTSRAFNRVGVHFGLDKSPSYEKLKAVYGDLINELKRTLNYVISLNPLDYLKMSFGNTWASCHTIDKRNLRHTSGSHYSGMYCGGTLSYMLDNVSFVNYVIPIEEKDGITSTARPDRWDKIYRNMFHLQGKQMIQGRVYPQDKDGNTDLYKVMRFAMQKALCEMFGIEYIDSNQGNDTWVMKGETCGRCEWYNSYGVHYRDYNNYLSCNLSYVRNCENTLPIEIGHNGIDVHSGEEYSNKERLTSGMYACLPSDLLDEIGEADRYTYIPE